MVTFPNSKINLGLNILRKRDDGFHDISTLFYPIPFNDALELISHPDKNSRPEFTTSGFVIEGNPEDNLCLKAYHALKQDHPDLPPVKIHLLKSVPIGAGLGGGSADAAFLLRMLIEKFNLLVSPEKLHQYAIRLGSDCPFFLINQPRIATGRGEILEEITLDLSPYKIILVNPGIRVNTAWAFSLITPGIPETGIKEVISKPVESWKNKLKNDFESPVFSEFPEIKFIKDELYKQGAVYAAMSGSGSTVFGIFDKNSSLSLFAGKNYLIKIIG